MPGAGGFQVECWMFPGACCGCQIHGDQPEPCGDCGVMEGLWSSVHLGFRWLLGQLGEVVEELQQLPGDLRLRCAVHRLQGKTFVCELVMGIWVGLVFLFRLVQVVRSLLYVRQEKRLAMALSAQIKKKCELTHKLRTTKKEYAEVELTLENARLQGQYLDIPDIVDSYKKVKRTKLRLMEELTSLVQEGQKGTAKCLKQEYMAAILKFLASLKETMGITSQGAFPNLPGGREPTPAGPSAGGAQVIKQHHPLG
ncbi:Cutaneous T-cell lymphoma-associated antigen 8 [Tupaia chinensis]|uniref:Cutaneous T-cell lymphoma-associated antigen 8 n=1 Tax=Tupaia chinensis TaxID=246437 RepID=L8YA55_TUPCH|nr:Cutaneous T-cell lymphoma-associated antigen 8 [Tupaia chinensis]